MIIGVPTNSSEEEESGGEEKTKWNKDVAEEGLLEGSYDEEGDKNLEDDEEWYKKTDW
jgi:hypothetical protein